MYIGAIPTPAATESRQEFTATANQTVFSTTGGTVGYCDCFLNGVKLANSDFSFDGADVTLTTGAAAGDVLAVVMRQADNALVALPIKDSQGNNVLSEANNVVSLSSSVVMPPGSVIEQFMSPCDGSSIIVKSGTYTMPTVTASQTISTTVVDVSGATITYTPPSYAKTVIYTFVMMVAPVDSNNNLQFALFVDDVEVTKARMGVAADTYLTNKYLVQWPFHIGGTSDATTGRFSSWTNGKEIKLKTRAYLDSHEMKLHTTDVWDGGATDQFSMPIIGITALA